MHMYRSKVQTHLCTIESLNFIQIIDCSQLYCWCWATLKCTTNVCHALASGCTREFQKWSSTGLGLFIYQRWSHQCFFLGAYLHVFNLKNMILTRTKDFFGERNGPSLLCQLSKLKRNLQQVAAQKTICVKFCPKCKPYKDFFWLFWKKSTKEQGLGSLDLEGLLV
jgi:hypothetical protein